MPVTLTIQNTTASPVATLLNDPFVGPIAYTAAASPATFSVPDHQLTKDLVDKIHAGTFKITARTVNAAEQLTQVPFDTVAGLRAASISPSNPAASQAEMAAAAQGISAVFDDWAAFLLAAWGAGEDGQLFVVKTAAGAPNGDGIYKFTNPATYDFLGSVDVTAAEVRDLLETLTGNNRLKMTKVQKFISTEQTANGVAQNIAHGLGRTPEFVTIIPTLIPAGVNWQVTEGSHDGTNVVVTVADTAKYKVVAW